MNHEVYVAVKDEHLLIHDTVIIMMTSWTFLENKALCFPPMTVQKIMVLSYILRYQVNHYCQIANLVNYFFIVVTKHNYHVLFFHT